MVNIVVTLYACEKKNTVLKTLQCDGTVTTYRVQNRRKSVKR